MTTPIEKKVAESINTADNNERLTDAVHGYETLCRQCGVEPDTKYTGCFVRAPVVDQDFANGLAQTVDSERTSRQKKRVNITPATEITSAVKRVKLEDKREPTSVTLSAAQKQFSD